MSYGPPLPSRATVARHRWVVSSPGVERCERLGCCITRESVVTDGTGRLWWDREGRASRGPMPQCAGLT